MVRQYRHVSRAFRVMTVGMLITAASQSEAVAQELRIGTVARVRATAPCYRAAGSGVTCPRAREVEGVVTWMEGDAVIVSTESTADTVRLRETGRRGDFVVRRLEIRRQSNRARTGFVVGGMVGVVAALAAVGPLEAAVCQGGGWTESPACERRVGIGVNKGVIQIVGGGLLGGAVGAVLGSFVKTEGWAKIALDGLRIDMAPRRRGMIALAFRF